jgi:RNase P subunit RPR2
MAKKTKRVMCRECKKMIRPGQGVVEVGVVGKNDFKPFHLNCGIANYHRMVDLEAVQLDFELMQQEEESMNSITAGFKR